MCSIELPSVQILCSICTLNNIQWVSKMLNSHQRRAALGHWVSWSTWAGLITQTCHLFVSPGHARHRLHISEAFLTALRTWGGRNKTYSSLFTQLEPNHVVVLEARLMWGCSLHPWTKSGHNQQVPPSPGGCQALADTNCWQDAPRVREDSFSSLFFNYRNFLCSFLQRLQAGK